MLGDWMRRTGFWSLDFFRGGGIRKNYKDVKEKIETGTLNKQQLQRLLNHATETVPFYKEYKTGELSDFPIVNKNILKEQWKEMHSVAFADKPLHYMATSGSTGTPFVMEWDMGKRKRQLAELIYSNPK